MSKLNRGKISIAEKVSSYERRNFVKGAAAGWLFLNAMPHNALASISNNKIKHKKLVWIFLRGALDSLHTVMPVADPNFEKLRANIITPIKDKLLNLDGQYALHPNLPFLHELYKNKQMSPVIAVASGYRERSHFEAQDQMESGLNKTEHENGWLARAVNQIQGNGLAISRSVPIALRQNNSHNIGERVETWYPSRFPEADEDVLNRLFSLYKNDEALNQNLEKVIAQKQNPNMQMEEKQRTNFTYLAEKCGELLAKNENTQCAMLEFGGWDTHNNQQGRLSRLFMQLDNGIHKLKTSMGSAWEDTLVVVSTEFGRTVALNGTNGTDHGTGTNMFLIGGALAKFSNKHEMKTKQGFKSVVTGGYVMGKWPGLAKNQLFEDRDLMPTSDVREWIALALAQHWQLNSRQISSIFPDLVVL